MAPNVQIRRVYDPPEPGDGYRVLIDHELDSHADKLDELRRRASKGTLTILYAARDRKHNNAVVVMELVRDG